MNNFDKAYHNLLQDILDNGIDSPDRTGTGTLSLFGRQVRYNLTEGFPLITTKKVHWKSIVVELLWILSGSTNVKDLQRYGVTIWDSWANQNGDLGPVYGSQWVRWEGQYTNEDYMWPDKREEIDQVSNVIQSIKTKPHDRGHIISAWNVADLHKMRLRPCHTMFQFYVRNNKLSCQLYQRSGDAFLGVPFNIASYALLTHMIAQVCDLEVGEFVHTFGDVHIYKNHIDQVKLQLTRESYEPPTLKLNKDIKNIDLFTLNDIILEGYNSHSSIKASVSV